MTEWIERHTETKIPGWEIEVSPGVVTLRDEIANHSRAMDIEHAIQLRDTLTEAIERAGGPKPELVTRRSWSRSGLQLAPSNPPEPMTVETKVMDRAVDIWTPLAEGDWAWGSDHFPFDQLLKKYSPLTELLSEESDLS